MAEPVHTLPPLVHDDAVRVALDCLSEGFQVIDANWKYVYLNPAAARHGRSDVSTLMGKAMMDAYPGIELTEMFQVLRECMERRTSRIIENQFTFPDGSTRWFELRISPVPIGICIYSADIEWRKHPRSLVARIRKMFE